MSMLHVTRSAPGFEFAPASAMKLLKIIVIAFPFQTVSNEPMSHPSLTLAMVALKGAADEEEIRTNKEVDKVARYDRVYILEAVVPMVYYVK
jgi:hypothetical protein